MVSCPVHSFVTIQIIEIRFRAVIVWMFMHRIAWLKHEILDVVSMKYIQWPITKVFYSGHHIRTLGNLRENSNTWRGNGPWIYANHHNTYILTINYGITNHCVCCNGDIECSGWFGAPPQGGRNTVHSRGWIWDMWTVMVLSHQSGSSTECCPWITYSCTTYCSSCHSY